MERFEKIYNDYYAWARVVFGENRDKSSMHHLLKECREVLDKLEAGIDPLEEYADCFVLLVHSMASYGYSPEQILQAAEDKLEKNKKRKWGTPDKNGVVEHIKGIHD